jgi:cellobiose phosphorylase
LGKFETKYGYFSDDGKEYIIKTPRTPRPWINVISNGDYGFVVSQTGSGYSWRTHAGLNRLTRWDQDLIRDEWGKYILIRDRDNGNLWSAGWKPVCVEPGKYNCRHGIGYTIIEASNRQIESSLLLFVPNDDPMELWKLTLRNSGSSPRRLSLFTYFEWGLGAAPDWHREFHKCFINTKFGAKQNAMFATKRLWEVETENGHWNTDWPYVAFHSTNLPVAGYEGDKESFLGMYGNLREPAGVNNESVAGHTGNSLDPIGSLRVDIDLGAGEEKSVCFTLGAAENRRDAEKLIEKYGSVAKVDKALAEVRNRWDGLLSTVEVNTPDEAMNTMLNKWLKYQAISGRLWGRTAYYQTGGAFGFRDQLQDSQIFLPIHPEPTKRQILLHARHQNKDGTVHHWWHPLTEQGLSTNMSDDLLWLPYLVSAYIEETADKTILQSKEPFLDDEKTVSILEHCNRSFDRVLKRLSKRGIPLIGAGDWNDGLSAVGLKWKGESIWLGHFLFKVLNDYAVILHSIGRKSLAKKYLKESEKLRQALNKHGWDGKWYWSATKDSGDKLGSHFNKEGKIHLNAQTWSVISGVADDSRREQAMNAVEKNLEKKAGPLLLFPAYRTPDEKIGYLTRYSPGMRENGGVYTHAATWAIIAEALLGRSEEAYRMFSKINPINRGVDPDEYCAEPYVTPGNIDGPESAFYGRGGWTWYSGSAVWLFKAGLEYILGIRPVLGGLIIDPCIPSEWKGFRVVRNFRGSTISINVVNDFHVSYGISKVTVDGKRLEKFERVSRGLLLHPFKDKKRHEVEVHLGK